jgi:hypothetical protein
MVLLDQQDQPVRKESRVQQGLKEWQDQPVRKVLRANQVHKDLKA